MEAADGGGGGGGGGNQATDDTEINPQPSRVAYFDIATQELLSFDLSTIDSELPLNQSHAIFVDATGDVWLTVEERGGADHEDETGHDEEEEIVGSVVQLDFDSSNGVLGQPTGRAIIHNIPTALVEPRNNDDHHFHIHGMQVVVDELDGTQYVYFVDSGEISTGRNDTVVGLLVPAKKTADAGTYHDRDHWFSWTVPVDEDSPATSQPIFSSVDDNETPGNPEDDSVIVSDSGFRLGGKGKGFLASIPVADVVRSVRAQSAFGAATASEPGVGHAQVEVIRAIVPKIPGGPANLTASGGLQTFVDRQGTIFTADIQGAVSRLNLDTVQDVDRVNARVRRIDADRPVPVSITLTSEGTPDSFVVETVSSDNRHFETTATSDRSVGDGVDQYEVAALPDRFENENHGPNRGFLNATNVLYGSISQSDHISTTVFAETARRQLAVVNSPSTPAGAVEGRMAFQVLRDGSLIMTGRANGQLLDLQSNINELLVSKGFNPDFIKFSGDVSAIVDQSGRVHIIGKQLGSTGQLIVLTYRGGWNSQAALVDSNNWGLQYMAPAAEGSLLVGDPTSFIDGPTGEVRFLVTTNTGQLLLYRLGQYDAFVVASNFAQETYGKVGVVQEGIWTIAYGTNQQGDLIEYGIMSDLSFSYARKVDFDRTQGHSDRDLQVFQDVEVVSTGLHRQVYATDGNSRLVHFEINSVTRTAWAENVTKIIAESMTDNTITENSTPSAVNGSVSSVDTNGNDLAEGYFPFQEAFAGRVYSGLEVLVDRAGTQFVYGTNGGELILFRKEIGQQWRVANLTNDIFSVNGNLDGPNRGGAGQAPAFRVSANNVFGSPGGYIEANGDRHLFQINKEGEVVEYFILADEAIQRFHTQNINFVTGGV